MISVVIATHDRETTLPRCISSLSMNKLTKGIEVIILVNGADKKSYHKTTGVIYRATKIFGLSHARNIGVHAAKGSYIAFIDDDAVATKDWVNNIIAFTKKYPDVAIFGGPYTSLNKDDIPPWIPVELTSKILPGNKARAIDLGREWLNGTNFVVKKSALEKVGGFNETLGVNGKKRGYGEETDLQIRLHNLGYDVWYDPTIKVKHEFATFKMNMWYLLKNQFIHGHNSREVFKNLKKTNRKHTASTIWHRILEPNIPLKRRIYYLLAPMFYLAGMFWANLG